MIGKQFVSAILAGGSVSALLEFGTIDHLFRGTEVEVYSFVKGFVKQYGSLPTIETVEAHTQEGIVAHKEVASYYADLMQTRHVELVVKDGMKKAGGFLAVDNKNPDKALEIITDTVLGLATQKQQKTITDFRHSYDLIMPDYSSKYNADHGLGLRFGWPTLDDMTGGIVKGDVVSEVGRSGLGKTWHLLFGAWTGWKASGETYLEAVKKAAGSDKQANKPDSTSRLFVSMEMQRLPIAQRLAAMQASIPATQLKHAALSTTNLEKLKKGLIEIKGYGEPFWIVDGNLTATVEDIYMLVRQLKPDAVFIDGAYLLKHPTERDRFKRVAENVDLIKQEIAPLAPVVCSWQFARSAVKKKQKKDDPVGLEDIGYSDAIGTHSSIVLGLFEEDSVETLQQRRIEVLKGRGGETGSFCTRWDFQKMDFTEIAEEIVEELQFV